MTRRPLREEALPSTGWCKAVRKFPSEEAFPSSNSPRRLRGSAPTSQASLLVTDGDNPERLLSEGSFACLCGMVPEGCTRSVTAER
jgi:hypothetical protein